MIWSEIIRGAKIRFDFTFSVLPLFVLFLSHEETSEIPLSSSIVLRRFPPISDDRETTRSIWGEMRCLHGKMRCLRVQESAFSHR
jgi:hypothetical protein